ncbi:MAG: aldo/keto reductase [Lachnospiraceae bacterium]|nr:aldo/keto reductase [Lachnospiraceae bacterium]
MSQGVLTKKYIHGIPTDSRAAGSSVFLKEDAITEEVVAKVTKLNEMAKERGQELSQMALAWALKQGKLTSVLIGASRSKQIVENVAALNCLDFSEEEMTEIEKILSCV